MEKHAGSIYNDLSKERKKHQNEGKLPLFVTTGGWQLLKSKYLNLEEQQNPSLRYKTIAATAAKHINGILPVFDGYKNWEDAFYQMLFIDGDLSPSTPVLSNMGTSKGLPVSCSGSYVGDSIESFYDTLKEAAILSKHGFGTSAYLDVRARGSSISTGGKASGVVPVFENYVHMSQKVSQGSQRRGAWAGYIDIEHGDFDEIVNYVLEKPDDRNIGFCIKDEYIQKYKNGDKEANRRVAVCLKMALEVGKGYLFKSDLANKLLPVFYKNHGLKSYASNLCTEINLGINEFLTFTCVLSSLNLENWDTIVNTKKVQIATIFLDCVVSEFIEQARKIKGLEKAVLFTEKARALGLGVCGFHTYLQNNLIPFSDLRASYKNNEIFKYIEQESLEASKYMAKYLGECELTKGYGQRNASLRAIAPTKSTALIMGGVSEGINPFPANTYAQKTPAGEIQRINPTLLKLLKSKNIHTKEHIDEIILNQGSVQNVPWLTKEEKNVFKTAFEIDQNVIMRYAANRQKHLDQLQSVNLFFRGMNNESYIRDIHQKFLLSDNLVTRYYVNGQRDTSGKFKSEQPVECEACQ